MGQKVHPYIQRIGIHKSWFSQWFTKGREFKKFIEEDIKIRKYIKERFPQAAISKILIERLADKIRIRIKTARPGMIIGRGGKDIESLREDLNSLTKRELFIDIEEIKNPYLDAQLIAETISLQLEKRIAYRRAMKRVIEQAMGSGVKGIKITCSGRLGGAEMCRAETYKQGKIPLQTLRADIDYGFSQALTSYGYIGVKVWLYKGDVLQRGQRTEDRRQRTEEKL